MALTDQSNCPFEPVWSATGRRHVGNYWEGYSLKMSRIVRLYSDLEYDHWVLVEADPSVIAFCEQPLWVGSWIDERWRRSRLDVWLRREDGNEEFREVKYARDLEDSPGTARIHRQIRVQKEWAQRENRTHRVITDEEIRRQPLLLQNWKKILHFLRTMRSVSTPRMLRDRTLDLCSSGSGLSMARIVSALSGESSQDAVRACLFRLLHSGELRADLATARLSGSTLVLPSSR